MKAGEFTSRLLGGGGAVLAFASFCAQQWLPLRFPHWWASISWGWIAAIFAALFVGSEIRSLDSGDHWYPKWRKTRNSYISISDASYQNRADHYDVCCEVTAARHVENVRITLDLFEMRHRVGAETWDRIVTGKTAVRESLNAGDKQDIVVARGKSLKAPEHSDPMLLRKEAFYRTTVSVTAKGHDAVTRDFDFWVQDGRVHLLPMKAPDGEPGRDCHTCVSIVLPDNF